MAWAKREGTRHAADCRMAFGRKDPSCPRCQELLAGAPARQWSGARAREMEAERSRAIHAHFASRKHQSGGCGPVCTFGEW